MSSAIDQVITPREVRLVALLARGYTTDRAAREMHLSRHTVGEVISTLLGRLDCQNRAELVAFCYAHRLLPVGVWPPDCLPGTRPSEIRPLSSQRS